MAHSEDRSHFSKRGRGRGGFRRGNNNRFNRGAGHQRSDTSQHCDLEPGKFRSARNRGFGRGRRNAPYRDTNRGFRNHQGSGEEFAASGGLQDKVRGGGCHDTQGWDTESKTDGVPKLDRETEAYFVEVYSRFQADFEDDEDKAVFVANVAEQTRGKELEVSCSRNSSVSLCVQMVLSQTTDPSVLTRFMTAFADSLRMVCTHCIASHIVQTLLEAALKYLRDPSSFDADGEESAMAVPEEKNGWIKKEHSTKSKVKKIKAEEAAMECEDEKGEGKATMDGLQNPHDKVTYWVLHIGRFCLENLEEFMYSPLASSVIRTVVQVLGGCNGEGLLTRNRKRTSVALVDGNKNECVEAVEVPEEFGALLKEFTTALKEQPDLLDIIKTSTTSLLLQTLMLVLHTKEQRALASLLEHVGRSLFARSSNEGELAPALLDTSASFMVEKVFKYSSAKSFAKLWKKYLSGQLLTMALHPVANFCVQRAIESAATVEQFQEMYDELAPGFSDLRARGHTTVLVCVAAACARFSTYQARFLKALMDTFDCAEPADRNILLVPLTLQMMTYDNYKKMKPEMKVVYQGSLLLQNLFKFSKTKKVVDSMLTMEVDALKAVVCCPRGSHVLDAFIRGPSIGDKARDKLVNKLRGCFCELAVDKYGSRVLDNLWDAATMHQKVAIAEELSQKEHLLTASPFGSFAVQKFNLYHFKHRRNEWNQPQKSKRKAADIFQSILKME
ncbi:unnamed protein product [Ixodes hexagonus]